MSSMIRMPLKLRLGKNSGRYELSQDIYVLSILVGDYLLVQCTLTSESSAQLCIEYLKEKIDLSQTQFFALRYQMKCNDPDRRMMRWVEMDKPLRKQLEKWACKPRQVQLAILFHTPNVFALRDPTARSLYYNLLKIDVTHGKFVMDVEKYINLAAYSMQVEYGDYNCDVHTMEFLRSLPLLPPHLYRSSQMVDDFLLKILTVYERLNGMQPSYAAFLYIVDAQQCEGYGEEFFSAKDDESTEVQVGYSPDGVVAKRCHSSNLKYRWQDIKDIVAVKRTLHVKCKIDANNGQFTLEDQELARYVAMVLSWQWQYALTDALQHKAVPMSINNLQGAIRTFGNQPAPTRLAEEGGGHRLSASSHCASQPSSSSSAATRLTPFVARAQPNLHAVRSFQHPANSRVAETQRNRSTTSTSAHHMANPQKSSTTQGQYSKQTAVYRPSITRQDAVIKDPNPTQPQFDSRLAEIQTLKGQSGQPQKSMGSSPEIHMIGTNNLRNYGNAHLTRRAQSNARGFQSNHRTNNYSDDKFAPSHTLSTPELALKWMSSPDLISSAVANHLAALRHQLSNQSKTGLVVDVPQASSMSSGSSSSRIHRAQASSPPQRIFSQGRVISGARQQGQPIIYPVPLPEQLVATSQPPPYHAATYRNHPPHLYYPNSLPQSSVASSASTDSYVRRLNDGEQDSDLDRESPAPVPDHSSRSSSPPGSTEKPMFNRNLLLNGVARSGSLANQQQHAEPTSNDETLRIVKEKLDTSQAIDAEFAAIPCKRLSAGVSTSQHPENQPRNRQGNVFPYEDTRVMLTPHARNADGYINASNVSLPVGSRTMRYLVCQAPMKSTTDDFWQMVWESDARLIVMLVNPHQVSKNDSIPPYWPTKPKEKLSLTEFVVKMLSSTTTKFQTTSVLALKNLRTQQRRTVYHMYCADFAADGVPSSESTFLGFIDAVNSLKRQFENERASEADSGVFSMLQGKTRSRTASSSNLVDVTNRKRSQSADGGGWKRKLKLTTASIHSPQNTKRTAEEARLSGSSDQSGFCDQAVEPPVVVHCTDGASESGVYLLVESLIQCIEHNVAVDVPNTLKTLRQQRMHLVRNVNQYRFAYLLLKNLLEQSRLI